MIQSENCLTPLVGIRYQDCDGQEVATSTRGLMINDLPGVSVRNADNAADQSYVNGIELLTQKIGQAGRELAADVMSRLGISYNGKSLLRSSQAGFFNSSTPETLAANPTKWRGVMFRFCTQDYLELVLEQVDLHAVDPAINELPWKIVDLTTGDTVQDGALPLVDGGPSIAMLQANLLPLNRDNYYAFVYLAEVDVLNTTMSTTGNNCCAVGIDCGAGVYTEGVEFDDGEPFLYGNRTSTKYTNGLRIRFDLECSADSFLCRHSKGFQYAMYWLTGSLVMDEMRSSTRLNSVITVYQDQWEDLADEYREKYHDQVDTVMRGISFRGRCFSCRPQVRSTVRIP